MSSVDSSITEKLGSLSVSSGSISNIIKTSKTWESLLQNVTKELTESKSPNTLFDELVATDFSYTDKVSTSFESKPVLAGAILSNTANKKLFAQYLESQSQDKEKLAQTYRQLTSKSDTNGTALLATLPILAQFVQRKILESALDSLKTLSSQQQSQKDIISNPLVLLDLHLVSRYFLHAASFVSEHGTSSKSEKDEELKYIKSQSHRTLSLISPYADRRLPPKWVSPVVMTIAKLIEVDFEGTTVELQSLIDDLLLISGSKDDSPGTTDVNLLIQAFSIDSLLFHINKDIGFSLFASEAILAQHKLFNTSSDAPSPILSSEEVVIAALDLLSSACVHKEARSLVKNEFLGIVKYAFELSGKNSVTILAASILVKTNYVSDQPKAPPGQKKEGDDDDVVDLKVLSTVFEEQVSQPYLSTTKEEDMTAGDRMAKYVYGSALEGLSFTSMLPDTKMRILSNPTIMDNLVAVIEKHTSEAPWVYCALSVFDNVTMYAPKVTDEQKRLNKLKEYAEGGTKKVEEEPATAKKDPSKNFEPDSLVSLRCKKILSSTRLVPVLAQFTPKLTQASRNTTARILRNLATEKTTRPKFVQQGGITVLLYLVLPKDDKAKTSKDEDSLTLDWSSFQVDPQSLVIATSGLSRALISVNPTLAFSNKISPAIAVQPLLRQFANAGNVGASAGSVLESAGPSSFSDIPLLDVFESLLALTNLAAVDEASRNLTVRFGWSKLEILLVSNNELVQRAAVELLCNLASSSECAEMFLDPDSAGRSGGRRSCLSRLQLLAALADLDDLQARLAATGAIALLTEWGAIAADMMRQSTHLIDRLVQLVGQERDDGVLVRVLSALQSLIGASIEQVQSKVQASETAKQVEAFLAQMKRELGTGLKSIGTRTKDQDVAQLASGIVGMLKL